MKHAAIFTIFAVALLCGAPLASSQEVKGSQPHKNQNFHQATDNQKHTTQHGEAISFFGKYQQEIAAYCTQKALTKEEKWIKKFACDTRLSDVVIALFTVLSVLIAVLVAVIGGLQLGTIRLTSQAQLRAYVSVDPESVDLPNQGRGNRFALNASIKNKGQTPAYNMIHSSVIRVHPLPLPDDFKFSVPSPPKLRARVTVGPGESSPAYMAADEIFPLDAIARGSAPVKDTLYCYGVIKYRDAFKHWHTTRFCFFFVDRDDGKTVVVTTSQHNEAD